MMLLLGFLYASIFLLIFHKSLKKYPNIFYVSAILLTAFLIIYKAYGLKEYFPDFINIYVIRVFRVGAFPTALFSIIMYLPIFKGKSNIVSKLYSIRAEMSIFAAIITLGHNLSYGLHYFPQFFLHPEEMKPGRYLATILTLILISLLSILTVTSFPSIRKKMKPKNWKNIQKLSYVFYMLIYVHVMVLFYFSEKINYFDVSIYSIIFLGYAILRIIRAYLDNSNKKMNLKSS
ncbi:MAG: hypothetical protein ACRDA4_03945 [Filifactoraceae bacterium]